MLDRVLEPEVMDTAHESTTYDRMDHRVVNARFVDDLLAIAHAPRRVLDLGTGPAHIPIVLASRAPHARVIGVDLARSMLELASYNVGRAALSGRIGLVCADVAALVWPKGHFDTIVSNSLVHHLHEPSRFFAAIARTLDERTTVFVRDLARPNDPAALEALVALHAGCEPADAQRLFAESLHAALRVDEVATLAHEAGLDNVDVRMTSDRHWTLVRRPIGP